MTMIVTIDGPAGAGKSSVARAVARQLGFRFLDTGAMYRAVAWAAIERGWPIDQPEELVRCARQLRIELEDDRVFVDGQDVSQQLRSSEVSRQVQRVADIADLRALLVDLQRRLAHGGNVITEGRDQGTVAFPEADCKIFLTASDNERARRRQLDLQRAGELVSHEDVLAAQRQRDERDRQRPVGALRQAADAVVVVTDGMAFQEVVDHLVAIIRARSGHKA